MTNIIKKIYDFLNETLDFIINSTYKGVYTYTKDALVFENQHLNSKTPISYLIGIENVKSIDFKTLMEYNKLKDEYGIGFKNSLVITMFLDIYDSNESELNKIFPNNTGHSEIFSIACLVNTFLLSYLSNGLRSKHGFGIINVKNMMNVSGIRTSLNVPCYRLRFSGIMEYTTSFILNENNIQSIENKGTITTPSNSIIP